MYTWPGYPVQIFQPSGYRMTGGPLMSGAHPNVFILNKMIMKYMPCFIWLSLKTYFAQVVRY